MLSWLLAAAGILLLIVTHELGHFAAAKLVGMRVERFSLFFPPRLFGVRVRETEYQIGAIPLGGYVRITGMNPGELDDLDPQVARRAYCNQPPWKRVAVILAGPAVNLLTAFLVFWVVLVSGLAGGVRVMANLNPSLNVTHLTTTVAAVFQDTAPTLRPGDRVLAVDGRPTPTPAAVSSLVNQHRCAGTLAEGCRASTPAALAVARSGRRVDVTVYPAYDAQIGRMLAGVELQRAANHTAALVAAGDAAQTMWVTVERSFVGLAKAFESSKVRKQVTSIVGITRFTHEAVQDGAGEGLIVLAYVSLILAVFNLLPFLPLDGGHLAWSLAEKARKRRVSAAAMGRFSAVGLIPLVYLVANGLVNDITRIVG